MVAAVMPFILKVRTWRAAWVNQEMKALGRVAACGKPLRLVGQLVGTVLAFSKSSEQRKRLLGQSKASMRRPLRCLRSFCPPYLGFSPAPRALCEPKTV